MASIRDGELLGELEEEGAFETEGLYEDEVEGEGIFGAIGNALGGLLGEGEEEFGAHELHELAHEIEGETEDEFGAHEFGAHEIEGETEDEFGAHEFGAHELHEFGAHEHEDEAEAFFGKLIRRALPILRQVAKIAAPAIGTAFGGPLGAQLGGLVARNLEGEYEDEFAHEGELEMHEAEAEYEAHAEAPVTESEAQAELMAAAAAGAQSEAEAEAMIGAATLAALTPRERRQLRRALPHMVRATAILTRLLRRRAPYMVRTVPSIVHHTARTLIDESGRTGRPITRRRAARVMTAHTRRHLCSPRYGSMALQRNVRATRRMQRVAQVPMRGSRVAAPAAARRRRARY